MSARVASLRPPYPVYDPTPIFGGSLPSIDETGTAPDVKPTSLMNPAYSVYAGAWGRNVAGLGDFGTMMDVPSADEGIRDYPNELNLLAAADDVQGNGVFDPAGSHGNVHPEEGIFADHESLPGYIVRDQFYGPSQVIDGTTGNPIMYVPSGAVAIDEAQREAVRLRNELWMLPPEVSPRQVTTPDGQPIVTPWEYGYPVSGLGREEEDPEAHRRGPGKIIAAVAIVGVAVGIFAFTLKGK